MIGQGNKLLVAENHKYIRYKFRTVVSEVSSFMGNPVSIHVSMLLGDIKFCRFDIVDQFNLCVINLVIDQVRRMFF